MARPWSTRLLAIGAGVGILAGIEVALRVAGVAAGETWAPPQLVTVVRDGQVAGEFEVRSDPHFAVEDGVARTAASYCARKGQGFPTGGSMRCEAFARDPDRPRYFVLGGSAAMGLNPVGNRVRVTWPTERLPSGVSALPDALSLSGQLEARLPVEVVNAGMIAQDSGGVRLIAEEVLRLGASGLVLYLGNNESLGLSWAMRDTEIPGAAPVRGALRHLRAYRLLAGWILARRSLPPAARLSGTGHETLGALVLGQWRSAGRPLLEGDEPTDDVYRAILRRFGANLRAITEAATARGARVYVVPAAPHLGYAPFSVASDPGLSESAVTDHVEAVRAAQAALDGGDPEQARDRAEAAVAIDPANAMGHYLLGLALDRLGDHAAAVDALERAAARDVSHKRVAPALARVAAEVCAEAGCRTLGAHAIVSAEAREKGLAVYEERWGDHEHLTPAGNAWVAGLFASLVLEDRR